MKKFASLLGEYIEALGMKQTHIASSAHISYNYLIRLLAGDRHPSESVVYKLAEAMRLSEEQTGELLAAAGYAPPAALLQSDATDESSTSALQAPLPEAKQATRIVQQFYRLQQEVPETLQRAFLEEVRHLLAYTRYKYLLCGGANLLDLSYSPSASTRDTHGLAQQDQLYLDLIAQLVGELQTEAEDAGNTEEIPQPPQAIEDILSAIDRLTGSILAGEVPIGSYQLQLIMQMFDMLREGAPWEIRHRIAKVLPHLFQFNIGQAEHLMETLRLDLDEVHGADIRRRVIETLPSLFQISAQHLPTIIRLLRPMPGDDIYVALATVEVCGDIQMHIKQLLDGGLEASSQRESLTSLLHQNQTEISRIQRQLVLAWDGVEKESLQYSMALHNLLCAPDTLLISLREGLQSTEKLMQQIAARYLERVLPSSPVEALELYKTLLHATQRRNLHRTVAKALPTLLQLLKEASLPTRILARDVISDLAVDPDIHVRRAVADYAMQIFHIDREFLLVLLRLLHKDKDHVIRHCLQPIALRLAQVWLMRYAEAAGLIEAKSLRGMHKHSKDFFGN